MLSHQVADSIGAEQKDHRRLSASFLLNSGCTRTGKLPRWISCSISSTASMGNRALPNCCAVRDQF
jgi:hypothetical protein